MEEFDHLRTKLTSISFDIIDKYNANNDLIDNNYIILEEFDSYMPIFRINLINLLSKLLSKTKNKRKISKFYLCLNDENKYFIIIAGKFFKKDTFPFKIIEHD